MCVTGIKTVGKRFGKLLAKTCLYSRQLFHKLSRVCKLVSDVWTIGKYVLVTVNQSKHALYSHDLLAWHLTEWQTQAKMKVKAL